MRAVCYLINEDGKLNQSSDVIRASEEEEPEPELVVAEQQVRAGGTLTMSMFGAFSRAFPNLA